MPSPTGILLSNLGTPGAPRAPEVRRYLREFLSDPRVLVMPAAARWALVNLVIAPFRAEKSAKSYRAVWSDSGSPLLVHGLALRDALRTELGVPVALGMRYGEPSLRGALQELRSAGCDRVLCAPLYPQFASSTTGSTLEALYRLAAEPWDTPYLDVLPAFFDDERFLGAAAGVAREALEGFDAEHVVFSFHGLPEAHLRAESPTCLRSDDCCATLGEGNRGCYRAQCFATARGLIQHLGLDAARTTVAFQSRLGRTPWIRPYTDETLTRLAAGGVRRVAVLSPSFVADCLETLEELGIAARDDFKAAGGEELRLVPALNAHPRWVAALADMLRPRLDEA